MYGQWRPGLPAPVSRLVLVMLTAEILVRGSDYLPGDPPRVTGSPSIVEQALPLPVWGVLCLTAGCTTTVGMILRRVTPILLGCVWAAGIYTALAWGLFLQFVGLGAPWGGWRSPAHCLLMAGLWVTLAVGMWWRWRLDEAHRNHGKGASW